MADPKKIDQFERLRKERRYVIVPVDLNVVAMMIHGNQYKFVGDELPKDALFAHASNDLYSLSTHFVFLHESFDPVPEATAGPIVHVAIDRVLDDKQ